MNERHCSSCDRELNGAQCSAHGIVISREELDDRAQEAYDQWIGEELNQ